jgi:hypothetical protein
MRRHFSAPIALVATSFPLSIIKSHRYFPIMSLFQRYLSTKVIFLPNRISSKSILLFPFLFPEISLSSRQSCSLSIYESYSTKEI